MSCSPGVMLDTAYCWSQSPKAQWHTSEATWPLWYNNAHSAGRTGWMPISCPKPWPLVNWKYTAPTRAQLQPAEPALWSNACLKKSHSPIWNREDYCVRLNLRLRSFCTWSNEFLFILSSKAVASSLKRAFSSRILNSVTCLVAKTGGF